VAHYKTHWIKLMEECTTKLVMLLLTKYCMISWLRQSCFKILSATTLSKNIFIKVCGNGLIICLQQLTDLFWRFGARFVISETQCQRSSTSWSSSSSALLFSRCLHSNCSKTEIFPTTTEWKLKRVTSPITGTRSSIYTCWLRPPTALTWCEVSLSDAKVFVTLKNGLCATFGTKQTHNQGRNQLLFSGCKMIAFRSCISFVEAKWL